jgi:hypothetical protein
MKKTIYALIILLAIFFSLPVIFRPIILSQAEKQLKNVFKDSSVSVTNCRLRPVSLAIFGIKIERKPFYDLRIEEARVSFRFPSIFKGKIRRVALKGIKARINTPNKKTAEFMKLLNLNTSDRAPFVVMSADIQGVEINVTTQDLDLACALSIGIDLSSSTVHYLALKVTSMDAGGMHLEGLSLGTALRLKTGNLYINQVKFDKARLDHISGRIVLGSKGFALDPLCAGLFGGNLCGNMAVMLDKEGQYALNLNASGVGLDALVDDFKLAERFRMTGKLQGAVNVKGKGAALALINGDLNVAQPGGTLVITDEGFLKNLAAQTQQSLEMLTESFKDYRYDTGIVRLRLDKGDLILDVALDGGSGKRDLDITLHNFNLKDYLPK